MALNGTTGAVWQCPLVGVEQKWCFGAARTVVDPEPTKRDNRCGVTSCC
jgi:hypothetical protein